MGYRHLIASAGGWSSFIFHNKFSIRLMYHHLRPQGTRVPWCRIIYNNQGSPKSKFISWLALNNRLYTRDRMIKWKLNCDPHCAFCSVHMESVQHLFFQCNYSQQIWQGLMSILGINNPACQWTLVVEWIQKQGRKSCPKSQLITMLFTEAVYTIWLQRNSQIFNNHHLNHGQAIREVVFRVSCRATDEMRLMLLM